MRKTITIRLSNSLQMRLDKAVEISQTNRSSVVRVALRQYLQRNEFQQLRQEMVPQAQAQGIYTDEDVFERIL